MIDPGDHGALATGTLVHALEKRAARDDDAPFVFIGGRPELTAAELFDFVRRCAAGFAGAGIGPGDRVLVALENSPEFLAAWLGAGYRGASIVPVVPRAGLRAFARALELTEPRLALANPVAVEKLASVSAPYPLPVIEIDDARPGGVCPTFESRLLARPDGKPSAARGQGLAAIMFTSGTSGPAKGVEMAHLWYVWASLDVVSALRYTADDTLYTCLPLGHANAQDTSFGPALLAGARIVFDREFTASRFWQRLAETGATAFNMIGNMAEVLLKRDATEFVRHRANRSFSVPSLAHQYQPFRERFGIDLVEGYGSTEIGIPVIGDPDHPRPGTAGRPLHGTQILIERDDGLPSATGSRGQICAWSPRPYAITTGYWRDTTATARAWSGGWFRSGDLGYLDADGYLTFAGRLTDSLRRKGENLSAFELETVLLEFPEVAECAILPRSRADGDDDIVVYVVLRGGDLTPDLVRDRFIRAFGDHAEPAEILCVDGLPHTESGKVAKGQLAAEHAISG